MNKTAINGIIGLMAIALLGIIALQAYWINERLSLTEDYFDKSVFAALNNVSKKLEIEEKRNINSFIGSSRISSNIDVGREGSFTSPRPAFSFGFMSRRHKTDTLLAFTLGHTDVMECTCAECSLHRFVEEQGAMEAWSTKQLFDQEPIQDRIRVSHLDTFLRQELRSKGINLEYTYGVFSQEEKDFVIRNGAYNYIMDEGTMGTISQSTPEDIQVPTDESNLFNSRYKVQLFQGSLKLQPPGYLMIHFPGKTGYVWRSVWTTVLAAILFTSIILFCFIYTVRVIFAQKKLSEIKSDFINNMTHEFKTPIATISLAADSITSPFIAGKADKVQRFADIIKQENRRMNKQVEKVLQMALLEKQDFSLKATQVNVHEVIRQAVNNIGLRCEKKGGKAEAKLAAGNAIIEADMTHFSNVVNNLLDNAYKYSPEQPEIQVITENVNNGVLIQVKDNGIGMSKEDRKHIFDKFFRVHTGNRHDVKGFGLGLSYVKAIVDAHKGQINVKSELGKGSEFVLFFPFKREK